MEVTEWYGKKKKSLYVGATINWLKTDYPQRDLTSYQGKADWLFDKFKNLKNCLMQGQCLQKQNKINQTHYLKWISPMSFSI